jgi:hypothetical protein
MDTEQFAELMATLETIRLCAEVVAIATCMAVGQRTWATFRRALNSGDGL